MIYQLLNHELATDTPSPQTHIPHSKFVCVFHKINISMDFFFLASNLSVIFILSNLIIINRFCDRIKIEPDIK